MDIDGSIAKNLSSAVHSARRLRDHPVHADTLAHWTGLLHHARRELAGEPSSPLLESLILELETELADRAG